MRNSCRGFSLVEMAFFITALGLIAVPAIKIYNTYLLASHMNTTSANLARAQNALDKYFQKNRVFPCPSSTSAPLDTSGYGQNAGCVTAPGVVAGTGTWTGATQVHFGALPTRVLGLPDSASVDGWGHRLLYAVTDVYTSPATPQQYMFSGSIRLEDSNLNSVTTPPNKVIYTVIAQGPDTRGAYTMNGALLSPCPDPGEVMTGLNCNLGYSGSYSTNPTPGSIFKPTFVQSLQGAYDVGANTFTSTMAFSAGPGIAPLVPSSPTNPPSAPAAMTATVKVSAWTPNPGNAVPSDWTPSGIMVTPGQKFTMLVTPLSPGPPNPSLSNHSTVGSYTPAQLAAYEAEVAAGATGWNQDKNCTGGFYGADGKPCKNAPSNGTGLFSPIATSGTGALIAKIGVNGAPFFVGASPPEMTASASGQIYYIMNDYGFNNNWGYQQVTTTSF